MILLETTASIMMKMMVTLTIITTESLFFTMMIYTTRDLPPKNLSYKT